MILLENLDVIDWKEINFVLDEDKENKRKLTSKFQELLKECIWDKYDKENSNIKNDDGNEIKLSMFKDMVDLYNLYVKTISESKKLEIDAETGAKQILIFSKPKKNGKVLGIDLYNLRTKLKQQLTPSEKMMTGEDKKNDDEGQIISNNLIMSDELTFFVKKAVNAISEAVKKKDKRDEIPKKFQVASYIKDFSVFCYFLDQMKMYLSEHHEVLKLDFILMCVYYFFGGERQFLHDLDAWLSLKGFIYFSQEQAQKSYEKYWVKWGNIKDVISNIRGLCTAFKFFIPPEFVLNCVIRSGEKERYSVGDLKQMTDEFVLGAGDKQSKRDFKVKVLNALANNPEKTIIFSNLPRDFTDLLWIFVNLSEDKKIKIA